MAGLVHNKECVNVGPPLSASGLRPALAMPTWFWWAGVGSVERSISPPEPPTPIKLKELEASIVPLMSSAVVLGLASLKLLATIVFCNVTVPEPWKIPPPVPELLLSLSARLLVIVLLLIVNGATAVLMPPPLRVAVLPLIVLLVMFTAVPPVTLMPPPV